MTPRSVLRAGRLAGNPVLRAQSDERLVDLVRAGCHSAFETIVVRYRSPLSRYCSRLIDAGRAEEVVQQTFVNAYSALLRDERPIRLRPWLYRIAHNAVVDVLRERAVEHVEISENLNGVERPDEAAERREGIRDLVAAVQGLPERQRDAVVLRELEGRSYDDIASELGVSGGAVRQLLIRARTGLRAGMTALTPPAAIGRLAATRTESVIERVGEVSGTAGAGAVFVKLATTTAVVAGGVVGGVAVAPRVASTFAGDQAAPSAAHQVPARARPDEAAPTSRPLHAGVRVKHVALAPAAPTHTPTHPLKVAQPPPRTPVREIAQAAPVHMPVRVDHGRDGAWSRSGTQTPPGQSPAPQAEPGADGVPIEPPCGSAPPARDQPAAGQDGVASASCAGGGTTDAGDGAQAQAGPGASGAAPAGDPTRSEPAGAVPAP